jgi:hypothetical protein
MNRPPSATHDADRTVETPNSPIESLVMVENSSGDQEGHFDFSFGRFEVAAVTSA